MPTSSLPAGVPVQNYRVCSLVDCDPGALATDLDCPSLRERMCYRGPTLADHLAAQRERMVEGLDLALVLHDGDRAVGVGVLLAYRDTLEAGVYLHDDFQGQGLLGPAAAVMRTAALTLGFDWVWVSVSADNDKSLEAVRSRMPEGSKLERRWEDEEVRPTGPREAFLLSLDVHKGFAGPSLTEDEDSAVADLVWAQPIAARLAGGAVAPA